MIKLDMTDPNFEQNAKDVMYLRSLGLLSDDELQKIYDAQVAKDKMGGEAE